MVTTSGPILDPEISTKVTEMPPVVVTTTGIPEAEHVTPQEKHEAPSGAAGRRHIDRWVALALAGVLAACAAAIAYILVQPVPASTHMGLSDSAWTEYRAGERAVATTGVGTPDWQSYRSGEIATTVWAAPNWVKAAALPIWSDSGPIATLPNQAKLNTLPIE